MANNVFANGRELACKAGSGKTICAFPDTCFTPPENPATPPGVPVPYPNTGFDSDTTNGSKTVKITKKEIMLKDQSYFKTSVGDEAGCAAKKGVLTSVNKGKVYFKSWSMDVKVEGENVDRHLDLTTNNHASDPGDTPPKPFTSSRIPDGLSPEDQKHAEECEAFHEEYKKNQRASQNHRKDERTTLKDKIKNGTSNTDEDMQFIEIEIQRIEFLKKELEGRKEYVDHDCDRVEWKGTPHDEGERRRRHNIAIDGLEGQVKNVSNLKGVV